MKTTATAIAALAAAAIGSAAWAETTPGGAADIFIGVTDIEVDFEGESGDADGETYGISGAWAAPLTDRLDFQVNGEYSRTDLDDVEEVDFLYGEAHLFGRGSDTGAFGGFVGVGNVDGGGDDVTFYGIGAEGALYRGNTTFDGAIAIYDGDDFDDPIYGISASATQFFAPNFAGTVGAAIVDVDGDTGYALDAGVEYQFNNSPFSGFAEVVYADIDDAIEATTFLVGVRVKNAPDLITFNRESASLPGGDRILGVTTGALGLAGDYTPPTDEGDTPLTDEGDA